VKNLKRYQKLYSARKRKLFLKSRLFWSLIIILILVSFSIYFLIFSKQEIFGFNFQIKKIEIKGVDDFLRKEIENSIGSEVETTLFKNKFSQGFTSRSIFLVKLNKIKEKILNNFLEIDHCELKRQFPQTLLVLLKKREPVGLYCSLNDCFFFDKEGVIFKKTETENNLENLILVSSEKIPNLGEKFISKEKINLFLEIYNSLKNLTIPVKDFKMSTEKKLEVKTVEEWDIYFNLESDIKIQLTKLSLLLKEISPQEREKLNYIDLRFSKVYYK